jgi:hypothetical protein
VVILRNYESISFQHIDTWNNINFFSIIHTRRCINHTEAVLIPARCSALCPDGFRRRIDNRRFAWGDSWRCSKTLMLRKGWWPFDSGRLQNRGAVHFLVVLPEIRKVQGWAEWLTVHRFYQLFSNVGECWQAWWTQKVAWTLLALAWELVVAEMTDSCVQNNWNLGFLRA